MKRVGLHVRMTESLNDLISKTRELALPFFQCFFVIQGSGKFIQWSSQEVADFVKNRRTYFDHLYAHGSYWVNLADSAQTYHFILERELRLARMLEFTHLVLHPGSVKGMSTQQEGIDAVARALNKVLRNEHTIELVLENTAHGNRAIGSDIHDLAAIYAKLDRPERVSFCLDTAHAHSYGYDLITSTGRDQFITLVQQTIGLDRISLLHINDTYEEGGSKRDRHHILGQGVIGLDGLKAFAVDTRLAHVPMLTEPPVISVGEEQELLAIMRSW